MKNKSEKRLRILSNIEYKEIYERPNFDQEDRLHFFSLDDSEILYLEKFRSYKAKMLFILQLGYFRYSYRFFNFSFSECTFDCDYIIRTYFSHKNTKQLEKDLNSNCAKDTTLKQRSLILEIFSFNNFEGFKDRFISKGKEIARIDSNPKYIFTELLKYSYKYQFIFPAYTTCQDIVSGILVFEENRIFKILERLMNDNLESEINNLLEKEISLLAPAISNSKATNNLEKENNKDNKNRYLLTLVKSSATGFNYQNMVKEIRKKQYLEEIFKQGQDIIAETNISNSTIFYFAKLVENYTIFQLQRFHKRKLQLYILCFAYYHYQKINDNLIKGFLYLMGKYQNNVREEINKYILEIRSKQNKNYQKIPAILKLITKDVKEDLTFENFQNEVFDIIPKDQIISLSEWLIKNDFDKKALRWIAYDKLSRTINQNIRQLFFNLDFSYQSTAKFYNHFFGAIGFLKNKTRNFKYGKTPTSFIKPEEEKFILAKNQESNEININASRYEILVYKILKRKITNNDIFIKDSSEYKHIDDDLLNESYFLQNHKKILGSLEFLPHINQPIVKTLKCKLLELKEITWQTNKRILNNQNPHFKIKDKDRWHLDYKNINHLDLNDNIFDLIPKIDLTDLINFVDSKADILSSFTHILTKNISNKNADRKILKAVITGYATNVGLNQMANSSGFTSNELRNVGTSFIRVSSLKIANEKLVNETKKLPIFEHYNIANNQEIFAAIDGQKYYMGVDAINARHSSKYFGKDKGVSSLTMGANFQALSSRIISANEYEGHYNLELYLMNESDIKPDYQSSDSHGSNDINFVLFDFFGCSFAPRFANLNHKTQFLYGQKGTSYPDNFILKPNNIANENLIVEEEMNIKRVVASLALKTATVSTIVKKICNSPKSNRTRKALSEYDKIIRSIHILKYIDDLNYRQYIQKAVNRIELYHKLRRKVGFENGGKIMVKPEDDQNIYQECNRLVCNMIVYYNSYILSKFLQHKNRKKQLKQIEALKQISPIAWRHINFYGKYSFDPSKNYESNLEKINQILAEVNLV